MTTLTDQFTTTSPAIQGVGLQIFRRRCARDNRGRPTPANSFDEQVGFAWRLLEVINDWVKHAETKLGVTLAFLGVVAVGFLTIGVESEHLSSIAWALTLLGSVSLTIAVIWASIGLLPRLGRHHSVSTKNLFFYRHIDEEYRNDPSRFSTDIGALFASSDAALKMIGEQCVANSSVAFWKFRCANRSIVAGFIAFVFMLAAGVAQLTSQEAAMSVVRDTIHP